MSKDVNLHTIIANAAQDAPGLKWTVTFTGAIRRSDGACPLEAAAGTGPHSLWTRARPKLAPLGDRDLERLSCAADMDWWPHRMAEYHIRRALLEGLGLSEPEHMIRREEAA